MLCTKCLSWRYFQKSIDVSGHFHFNTSRGAIFPSEIKWWIRKSDVVFRFWRKCLFIPGGNSGLLSMGVIEPWMFEMPVVLADLLKLSSVGPMSGWSLSVVGMCLVWIHGVMCRGVTETVFSSVTQSLVLSWTFQSTMRCR